MTTSPVTIHGLTACALRADGRDSGSCSSRRWPVERRAVREELRGCPGDELLPEGAGDERGRLFPHSCVEAGPPLCSDRHQETDAATGQEDGPACARRRPQGNKTT